MPLDTYVSTTAAPKSLSSNGAGMLLAKHREITDRSSLHPTRQRRQRLLATLIEHRQLPSAHLVWGHLDNLPTLAALLSSGRVTGWASSGLSHVVEEV